MTLPKNEFTYLDLFANLSEQEVGRKIETRVMIRIERSRMIQARIYFTLHATFIIVAVAVCIPVTNNFITTASQSGLVSYLSLFASDGTYVLSAWKDLGLSIIESFPVIETTALLALILIIGNSLRRGTRYVPSLTSHRYTQATL